LRCYFLLDRAVKVSAGLLRLSSEDTAAIKSAVGRGITAGGMARLWRFSASHDLLVDSVDARRSHRFDASRILLRNQGNGAISVWNSHRERGRS
jgi:hypothetical protein